MLSIYVMLVCMKVNALLHTGKKRLRDGNTAPSCAEYERTCVYLRVYVRMWMRARMRMYECACLRAGVYMLLTIFIWHQKILQ